MQAVEYVPLPHELFFQPEIGKVAAVNYEIDVVAGIDGLDGKFRFVIPALGVADHGETDGSFVRAGGLDTGDVAGVDIAVAFDIGIVGVVFEMVAAGNACQ